MAVPGHSDVKYPGGGNKAATAIAGVAVPEDWHALSRQAEAEEEIRGWRGKRDALVRAVVTHRQTHIHPIRRRQVGVQLRRLSACSRNHIRERPIYWSHVEINFAASNLALSKPAMYVPAAF